MSDDNLMYDSPTEFLHAVAQHAGLCVAQSVIPDADGTYRCACSCEQWEVTVPDREEGLRLARLHTGSAVG
jgi:hypothetical protein